MSSANTSFCFSTTHFFATFFSAMPYRSKFFSFKFNILVSYPAFVLLTLLIGVSTAYAQLYETEQLSIDSIGSDETVYEIASVNSLLYVSTRRPATALDSKTAKLYEFDPTTSTSRELAVGDVDGVNAFIQLRSAPGHLVINVHNQGILGVDYPVDIWSLSSSTTSPTLIADYDEGTGISSNVIGATANRILFLAAGRSFPRDLTAYEIDGSGDSIDIPFTGGEFFNTYFNTIDDTILTVIDDAGTCALSALRDEDAAPLAIVDMGPRSTVLSNCVSFGTFDLVKQDEAYYIFRQRSTGSFPDVDSVCELFKYDLTTRSAESLAVFDDATCSGGLFTRKDSVQFELTQGATTTLWSTSGSSPTQIPYPTSSRNLVGTDAVPTDSGAYFLVSPSSNPELRFLSDTRDIPILVSALAQPSDALIDQANSVAYFVKTNPTGTELWVDQLGRSRGLTTIDIGGNANPRQLTLVGSSVYYIADNASESDQLWRTSPQPITGDFPLLVTTPDRLTLDSYGWVIFETGRKQWVSTECRRQLQAQGFEPQGLEWSEIGTYPDTAPLSCAEILALKAPTPSFPRILATPDRASLPDYGWVLFADGTKQWVNATCRGELVARGLQTDLVEWSEISTYPDGDPVECDDITLDGEPAELSILVTPDRLAPGNYGWVVFGDGTKQWIDGTCRDTLEAAGVSVTAREWVDIDTIPDRAGLLSCSEIQSL